MADPIIRVKRSSVSGKIPTIADVLPGEFAINSADGKVFIEKTAGITSVIAVNPWDIGFGTSAYDITFTVGNVGVGTTAATRLLDVNGTSRFRGALYDFNNSAGTDTQVLTSTGSGVSWTSASGGASALNDLTDVTITSATQDNILRYTGSAWINDTNLNISGVSTFAGLTTVTGSDLFAKQVNVSGATTFYGDVSFTGATYTLLWDASENSLEFPDNAQFRFGDSADMVFYHNGFNSIIVDQGGGDLYLAGDANIVFTNSATTETKAVMTSDGPVDLYYDNVKKFETSIAGVLVSGQTTTSTLNVTGVSTFGGNIYIDAGLYDINNSLGSDTYVLTSTGAGVSWAAQGGSAGVSTHKHITTYGAGSQTNTTEVTVDLDTTGQSSGTGDFTVSATGVVTVINAGRYLIHYSVSTDVTSGSARSGTYVYLRLNGSGEVTASRSYMYNRSAANGGDTASKQLVMNLAANDTLELRSVRYAGTDTTVVLLDYSTFTIESIEYTGGSGGGGGGASALNDLTDVTLSSPTTGQVLKYNGSVWVNDADATGAGGSIVVWDNQSIVGTSVTTIDFGDNLTVSTPVAGIVTVTGSASGGGGDGGTFNTGITTSLYHSVTSGIGANQTEDNNIFIGPGVAYTFPATAGKRYIVESIQLANIDTKDLYVVSRHDFSGFTNVPIAQRVVIPYQGALELLENPVVFNPSDTLRLQAMDGVASTANGVNSGMDAFIVWTEKTDTAYIGTGATITSTDQSIYTASSQTVVETISATNYNLSSDVDVTVSIFRGGTRLGYLCKSLTVPKNSVVDVISKPKYLAIDDSLRVSGSADGMAVRIAGKTY